MPMTLFLFSYCGGFLLSLGWLFIHRRGKHNALPNHRSSHEVPTPQGGGIAIALVAMVALWALFRLPVLERLWLLVPFGVAVLAGWIDDFYVLSGRLKLLFIGVAVIPLLSYLPDDVIFSALGEAFSVGFWVLIPILFLGLIWLVNLTNFMDGINGLAVLEVLFMLLAIWYFQDLLLLSPIVMQFIICVAVACIAFLPFNFPRALLFLGDTGSLFLGTLMAWLLIVLMTAHPSGLWVFLTLFAMFWVDATFTLLLRLARKKSIFEAHREHAYQNLANEKWQSHTKATLFIMLINVVWLLPMSYMVLSTHYPILWLIAAIIPVLIYCLWLKAGREVIS